MPLKLPRFIGHRGLKDLAPENTLSSIELAINNNIKWIEVDIQFSKDNIPFLLHDETFNRTTNGNGFPKDYDFDQIKTLDAGSWFNNKYKNLSIPSLEEVLNICTNNKIGLNIEMKESIFYQIQNLENLLKILKKPKYELEFYISSFNINVLNKMREVMPDILLGYLVDDIKNNEELSKIIYKSINSKCFCIGLNIDIVTKEIIRKIKENNFIITIYSNKCIKSYQVDRLLELGVDSIFIDNIIELD